jgi:hypothetical protein
MKQASTQQLGREDLPLVPLIILGVVESFRGLDGCSIGSFGAIQDMLVVREPVPTSSALLAHESGVDRKDDSLAEEIGKTSKLGSVSRGVIVKLVDRDSMEFHVGRDRKLLWSSAQGPGHNSGLTVLGEGNKIEFLAFLRVRNVRREVWVQTSATSSSVSR